MYVKLGFNLYFMRHALCNKNGDLIKYSRVNPYVRMRMRFS